LGFQNWTLVWPKVRPGVGLGSGSSSVLSFCHNLSSGSFTGPVVPVEPPLSPKP
jgi:hypothetical protein